MRAALCLILAAGGLLACAPVSVQSAEAQCYEEARLAAGPRGELRLGAAGGGSGGTRGALGLRLDLSSDYLAGRDPEKVWQRCVLSRSGQMPTRALADASLSQMPRTGGRVF